MRTSLTFLAVMFSGCAGSSYQYAGYDTYEYFPLDGERMWEYATEDTAIDWNMEVEKVETQNKGDTELVTLEYAKKDPIELLHQITFSSNAQEGILIYGYAIEGGESVDFSTPVTMGAKQMSAGDKEKTKTDGVTYTAEMNGVQECPNLWVTDTWDCIHITITDGTDDETSPPFVGDWWIASNWGTSRFQHASMSEPWVLARGVWCPEGEDC